MLILKKLHQGAIYPQLTDAPISKDADFLNFFRGGHTIDDNMAAESVAVTLQAAALNISLKSGYLTNTRSQAIPDEFLVDVFLTASGSELIRTAVDRPFCEIAVAESRKSIAEKDGKPHPYVGAVIVKSGDVIAKGFRGESGTSGDHGEFCAIKKLSPEDPEFTFFRQKRHQFQDGVDISRGDLVRELFRAGVCFRDLSSFPVFIDSDFFI
jgi:hypothetical protein